MRSLAGLDDRVVVDLADLGVGRGAEEDDAHVGGVYHGVVAHAHRGAATGDAVALGEPVMLTGI